jgi:hypothetical protein
MSKSAVYTLEKIAEGLQELKINDLTDIESHNKSVDYWIEEINNHIRSYGESVDIISRAASILKNETP